MDLIKKRCEHCGKEIESLYEKQAEHNLNVHKLSCKENPKNKRRVKKK